MLKFSACSENCKKACWTFRYVLKTVTHVEKGCWKFQCMLKTVMQVQNYVEYFKVCWKTSWKFQGMLKTVICVENYVETACWTFQCVLKTVMHVENYVEISRCVENVYVRHVENHVENCVEIWKNHHHTLRCVLKLSGRGPKIRRQTARFDSEFTRVSEVRLFQSIFISQMSNGTVNTTTTVDRSPGHWECMHWFWRVGGAIQSMV